MTDSRYGKGLILAITTTSMKVRGKEIYQVVSEKNPNVKYTVNFEDGTCSCSDFKHRGEVCKHFYKVTLEKAIL
jgi:SWIM zinc finger